MAVLQDSLLKATNSLKMDNALMQPAAAPTDFSSIEQQFNITADGAYNGAVVTLAKSSNNAFFLSYYKGTTHTNITGIGRKTSIDGVNWSVEVVDGGTTFGGYVRTTPARNLSASADPVTTEGYNRSTDGGLTWSAFTPLPAGTTPFVTLGFNVGTDMYTTNYGQPSGIGTGDTAWLWKSSNDGVTWTRISEIRQAGDPPINETGICYLGGSKIMSVSRNDSGGTYVHFSNDMGLTWGASQDYTLQLGNLHLPQIMNLGSTLLLVARQFNLNKLNMYLSFDAGKTFTLAATLNTYTGNANDGGYSWPIKLDDHRVLIVYYADANGLHKPDIKASIVKFKGAPIV